MSAMPRIPGYDAWKANAPEPVDVDEAWAEYVRSREADIAEEMVRFIEMNAPCPGWAAWEKRWKAWWAGICHRCDPTKLKDFPEPEPTYRAPEGPRAALVAANRVFLAALDDYHLEQVALGVDILPPKEQWAQDWTERQAEAAWEARQR